MAYSHYDSFGAHVADIFGRAVIHGAVEHVMRRMSGPEILVLVLLVLGGWWLPAMMTKFDATPLAIMNIYDFPTGPYPARVRIALAEKNLQSRVRFNTVDLYKGEHKTRDFIATKNYSGTLPVLELDDGTLIAECTAITEYLDTLDGAPTLTGRTPREKGLIHMMNKRAELELLDAISVYFHHATPGLGPDVEIYQNAEWGLRQRDKALRGMHYFDGVLKKQTFVAGDFFSMADITVIGGLIFAGLVKLPVPAACEALHAWYARMQERPSVRNRVTMSEPAV